MKNYFQSKIKSSILIAGFIAGGYFSSPAQDSIKIKNRHDKPDTSVRDTVKLKGGALIDTINIKKPGNKMQVDTTSFEIIKDNVYAFYQDGRSEKLASLEKQIASLKSSMKNKTVAEKSSIATIENKKNELKEKLKNAAAMDSKQQELWDKEYAGLKEKVEKLSGN